MADDHAKHDAKDDAGREPSYDIQTRYLSEIGRYELLTAEEEIELGRRMAEGDEEARRRMIICNLRLVVTIAKRYSRGNQNLLDLIEDGNLGLIRAATKFDYTRGFRFSTYASYWIKQSIKRGIAGQSRVLRIPVHIYHLINRYVKKEEELKATGRTITDETMSEALEISVRRIKLVRSLITGIRSEDPMASADALQSLSADPQHRETHTPEALVTLQLENKEMTDLFDRCLSPREQEVLILRYGLDDGEPRTLGEAGRVVGVSRERVRQIEKRALQKLNLMLSVRAAGKWIMSAIVTASHIRAAIRDVPDFPKPGILFKDITPILNDPVLFAGVIQGLAQRYQPMRIDKIAAMESRGFIFGAPLAEKIGVGFVPLRKFGKLPHTTVAETFNLEYGTETLEVHTDAIQPGERVLIIDDLLATGGTAEAAIRLIRRIGGDVVEMAFVVELAFLNGRGRLAGIPVYSMVVFE